MYCGTVLVLGCPGGIGVYAGLVAVQAVKASAAKIGNINLFMIFCFNFNFFNLNNFSINHLFQMAITTCISSKTKPMAAAIPLA